MSEKNKMSPPEQEVSKLLDELGIWWKFEFPVFLWDENDRPRIWTPDFYLPKLGIFVEVCGSSKVNYNYREKIYDKNVSKIIFVHYYKEPDKWKTFFVQRLFDIQNKRLKDTGYAITKARELGYEIDTTP